ncbi:hypothetical protein EIP91_001599 [Steccherinum ochraceum]|uniref:Uncharacterized protein n=1 Tax=Steccherinum ochraceum TaxID=92696 RepID=A0A4R0RDQ1_9APHY|nr:hypothetical protein EIP91_001599 [Steccherinum ochraceum]
MRFQVEVTPPPRATYHNPDVLLNTNQPTASSLINSRIPPELLSAIFALLVKECALSSVHKVAAGAPSLIHNWLSCTHVCRRWRLVALECSSMWSYVFIGLPRTSLASVQTMLTRSREAPLTVSVGEVCSKDEVQSLEMIMGQLERIQELRFFGSVPGMADLVRLHRPRFARFATRRAPLVRVLVLKGRSIWPSFGDEATARTENGFSDDIVGPHLRWLACSSFSFHDAARLMRPSLTHLILHSWTDSVTVPMLLRVLTRTPQLRHLELARRWNDFAEDGRQPLFVSGPSVDLPLLCDVVVLNHFIGKPWLAFLKLLSFPATTRISYRSSTERENGETLVFFREMLSQRVDFACHKPEFSWPFSTLSCVTRKPEYGLHLHTFFELWMEDARDPRTFFSPTPDAIDMSGPRRPYLQLDFYHTPQETLPEAFSISITGVRTVFLNMPYDEPQEWHKAFGHLQYVDTLCFTESRSLLHALETQPDGETCKTLFPNLKRIVMGSRSGALWSQLYSTLMSRATMGSHFEQLVLVHDGNRACIPPAELLHSLRQIVRLVQVTVVPTRTVLRAGSRDLFQIMNSLSS